METTKEKRQEPKDTKILVEQYKIAVELYLHEDTLNWAKLNHLFYINVGLLAVLVIMAPGGGYNAPIPTFVRLIVGIVSITGTIVSLGLGITLWYGTKYMQARKEGVIDLDEVLERWGGGRVVSPSSKAFSKEIFLKISPTTWILRLLPVVLVGIWISVFVVNMLHAK